MKGYNVLSSMVNTFTKNPPLNHKNKYEDLIDDLAQKARETDFPIYGVEITGDYRRGKQYLNALEFLVFTGGVGNKDFFRSFKRLLSKSYDIDIKGISDKTFKFLIDVDGDPLQVIFHSYKPEERGIGLLIHTGSQIFIDTLKARLREAGYIPSRQGIKDKNGNILARETEEEIFQCLGVNPIDPKDRETAFVHKVNPVKPVQKLKGHQQLQIPSQIAKNIPESVKTRLQSYKLPELDAMGNKIPADILWNPIARLKYFKSNGVFKVEDELRLERYADESVN